MTTSRNVKSAASKAMWKKVDEAASRAPEWVRSNVSELAAKHTKVQREKQQPPASPGPK